MTVRPIMSSLIAHQNTFFSCYADGELLLLYSLLRSTATYVGSEAGYPFLFRSSVGDGGQIRSEFVFVNNWSQRNRRHNHHSSAASKVIHDIVTVTILSRPLRKVSSVSAPQFLRSPTLAVLGPHSIPFCPYRHLELRMHEAVRMSSQTIFRMFSRRDALGIAQSHRSSQSFLTTFIHIAPATEGYAATLTHMPHCPNNGLPETPQLAHSGS